LQGIKPSIIAFCVACSFRVRVRAAANDVSDHSMAAVGGNMATDDRYDFAVNARDSNDRGMS